MGKTSNSFYVTLATTLCMAALSFGALAQGTETPGAGPEYATVFSVDGKAVAYDSSAKSLTFFSRSGGILKKEKSLSVPGHVYGIEALPNGYAVLTGMGRGDLSAPLRVTLYDLKWLAPQVVFEKSGERSQASMFRYVDGKLWITFFDSKFVTHSGYFEPSQGFPWNFTKVHEMRLGDATDITGDYFLAGQPYGEVLGQDGGAVIFKGSERTDLPSYRGVRAVAILGNASDPHLLIADGWHQNYGQFAQARLSYLKRDVESKKFALQVLDWDKNQYGFSKLIPFSFGSSTFVAALGNKQLDVYGPEGTWTKKSVYERPSEMALFDVALLGVDDNKAWFVVIDNGLKVVNFVP